MQNYLSASTTTEIIFGNLISLSDNGTQANALFLSAKTTIFYILQKKIIHFAHKFKLIHNFAFLNA